LKKHKKTNRFFKSYLELLSQPSDSFDRLLQLQCLKTNNWKQLKWTNR